MAIGESGRIVIDVEPEMKRQLYSTLALSGRTLKDWFLNSASQFCDEQKQGPTLFEYSQQANGSIVPTNTNGHENTRFKVVSMFSGCGGMDLGFTGGFKSLGKLYKRLPFDIIWANDISAAACKTYKRNLGHDIHCGDVNQAIAAAPLNPDILVGGFPCQDISINGKRAGVNGTRSGLYRIMVGAIERLKPKVFVAENVKGLLMKCNARALRQVIDDFESLGYLLNYQLYNAADYGVPQTRERVFIVGTLGSTKPFVPPPPTRTKNNWRTAKEALSDLETLEHSPKLNHIWSLAEKSPEQGSRRLSADRPAHTIRAECHGNIQFHYRLPRRISMREAARCQTFPDSFIFEAGLRETERQVGNAVPPVLAWHIAKAVENCLK
jgi:DNA (cytosine-5)-methyltransferase 1